LIDLPPPQTNKHTQKSLEDVHAAISALKASGLVNYSVDLIGGLPGQVRVLFFVGLNMSVCMHA